MDPAMTERADEPVSDVLSSAGLFLNVGAVLTFAIGLAGLSMSAAAVATVATAAALFAASLVCFAVAGRRVDAHRSAPN